jgi:hypothetical protein
VHRVGVVEGPSTSSGMVVTVVVVTVCGGGRGLLEKSGNTRRSGVLRDGEAGGTLLGPERTTPAPVVWGWVCRLEGRSLPCILLGVGDGSCGR